jgi:hypothetical protein
MFSSRSRRLLALLNVTLFLATTTQAFNFPLSSEAVREAYFLGQRHDNSTALYLDTYSKHLQAPKFGPYISSATFLTPFAQLVRLSSEHSVGYSSQQAQQDYRNQKELVEISIEIDLTDTYSAILTDPPPARSSNPSTYRFRPSNFWTDFDVQVLQNDRLLEPTTFTGKPNYRCSYEGGCTLTGATITLTFPASLFDSDEATIAVTPPEGDPVAVDFDLTRLR